MGALNVAFGVTEAPVFCERRPWSIRSESAAGSYFSLSCSARRADVALERRLAGSAGCCHRLAAGRIRKRRAHRYARAFRCAARRRGVRPGARRAGISARRGAGALVGKAAMYRTGHLRRDRPTCTPTRCAVPATASGARGFAQALLIPFLAVATVRHDWTIDIALPGVVFQSATLLATGIYLLIIAAAGYYVRYFGGTWGKRSRSASFSRRS